MCPLPLLFFSWTFLDVGHEETANCFPTHRKGFSVFYMFCGPGNTETWLDKPIRNSCPAAQMKLFSAEVATSSDLSTPTFCPLVISRCFIILKSPLLSLISWSFCFLFCFYIKRFLFSQPYYTFMIDSELNFRTSLEIYLFLCLKRMSYCIILKERNASYLWLFIYSIVNQACTIKCQWKLLKNQP